MASIAGSQINIMGGKFLAASGSGSTSDALECLEYAVANGAAISSNSWGSMGTPSPILCQAIEEAASVGHLFIAAAGNDASDIDVSPSSPCSCSSVLCVASTTNQDSLSWFSNYGDNSVHVGAPGSAKQARCSR